jgi:hypothetical protein
MLHSRIRINENKNNYKLIFFVFSFFALINIASSGGHFDVWDGSESFLVTESMVLKHTAKLDPGVPSIEKLHFDIHFSASLNKALHPAVNNRDQNAKALEPVYTVRSLLLSAIAVPFYYAAVIFSVPPIPLVAIFVNSLLISLICVVIFCFSLEIYGSKNIAFMLSLIFGVCSFAWPYHTTLWPQPLQALCIITSAFFIYISLHRHSSFICHFTRADINKDNLANETRKGTYFSLLAGLFLGLSVFAHPSSLVLIPGFIAYCAFSMRRAALRNIISFIVILGITLFFMGVTNYVRFGSFTDFGYGYQQLPSQHAGRIGLIGLLASPQIGLIFYFPISILAPLAFKYMYKKDKGIFFLSIYVFMATWLYFGTLSYAEPVSWTGGVGWGPRYLIVTLPFIAIVTGTLLNMKKSYLRRRSVLKLSIIILSVAGFYVNLVGTLVWMFDGFIYGFDRHAWSIWNPYGSPIILHTKAMIENYVSHTQPGRWNNASFWSSLEQRLAPCSYDIYIFCKFGIVPILLLSVVIGLLAKVIMTEIRNPNSNDSTVGVSRRFEFKPPILRLKKFFSTNKS